MFTQINGSFHHHWLTMPSTKSEDPDCTVLHAHWFLSSRNLFDLGVWFSIRCSFPLASLGGEPWKRMEKDWHNCGFHFHCAGFKRAFFHLSPGLLGGETPTNYQFLLHWIPTFMLMKLQQSVRSLLLPSLGIVAACPALSGDRSWALNQESPRGFKTCRNL